MKKIGFLNYYEIDRTGLLFFLHMTEKLEGTKGGEGTETKQE